MFVKEMLRLLALLHTSRIQTASDIMSILYSVLMERLFSKLNLICSSSWCTMFMWIARATITLFNLYKFID